MKKYTLFILIFMLLFTSACQSNQPVNKNPAYEQAAGNQQDTKPPAPAPTKTPLPEPTETLIPPLKPTPTFDLMHTRFSVNSNELQNLTDGGPIISIAWHPDSTLFANSGVNSILIWKTSKLTHAFILEGHEDVIIDLGWSPDGNTLASLSLDETIRLWVAPDYQASAILDTGKAGCFDWSPLGGVIAVGMLSGEIQLWDVETAQIQDTLSGSGTEAILQVMWSSDGDILAAGDASGAVYIWSVENHEIITTLADPEGSPANDFAWSPDGQYLATAHQNGFVYFWDPGTWEIVRSIEALKNGVTRIAWSPDSLMIATGGDFTSVPVWEAASGEMITGLGIDTIVWSLEWSPNGKYLTVGSAGRLGGLPSGGTVTTWFGYTGEDVPEISVVNPDAGLIYFYIRTQ